jgi:hypothetical protein
MRKSLMVGIAGLVTVACSQSYQTPAQPDALTLPLRVEQRGGLNNNHSLHLTGAEEPFTPATPTSPTPADSQGQGQAIIKIANDDLSFDYKLIASNIENITMAHIHCGPAGANGPIMIWLYPSPDTTTPAPNASGRHDGVLAEGTVKSSVAFHVKIIPTSHAVCTGGVADFAQALAKIRAGQAYVNVHTNDGVAPSNQGPGDFPGGEIRAQFNTDGK